MVGASHILLNRSVATHFFLQQEKQVRQSRGKRWSQKQLFELPVLVGYNSEFTLGAAYDEHVLYPRRVSHVLLWVVRNADVFGSKPTIVGTPFTVSSILGFMAEEMS
jgi:hypothetical protein